MLSKPLSFRFPLLLCSLMSIFLLNLYKLSLLDETRSSFPVNFNVSLDSPISPIIFLLFINNLIRCSFNSIHFNADDSTNHFPFISIRFLCFAYKVVSQLQLSEWYFVDFFVVLPQPSVIQLFKNKSIIVMNINNKLYWKSLIATIAKLALRKMGSRWIIFFFSIVVSTSYSWVLSALNGALFSILDGTPVLTFE